MPMYQFNESTELPCTTTKCCDCQFWQVDFDGTDGHCVLDEPELDSRGVNYELSTD